MNFIKKNETVANPARKNDIIFQNSYQTIDHYDIKYGNRQVPVYGFMDFTCTTYSYNGAWALKIVNNCGHYEFPYNTYFALKEPHEYFRGFSWPSGTRFSSDQTIAYMVCDKDYTGGPYSTNLSKGFNLYINGVFITDQLNYTFNLKDKPTSYRNEQYEISRTPIYRTDWNTKWKKINL